MTQERRQSERLKRIVYRWIDLATLSVTGVFTCVLLQPAIADLGTRFADFLARWHWCVSVAVAILITTMLWFVLAKLGGACLCSLRRPSWGDLCNPPVWAFGVVPCISFLLAKVFWLKSDFSEERVVSIVGVGLIIFVFVTSRIIAHAMSWVFAKCQPRMTSTRGAECSDVESSSIEEVSADPAKLIRWIHKEEPVLTPHEDRFDMAVFARRIVRVLRGTPLKTIGLVGPYGCGKTSILHMVDHYVEARSCCRSEDIAEAVGHGYPPERIITCWVSGWGFREATAAEHVLRAAVEKLGQYTDCLGLVNLPADYSRAVADSGNALTKILCAVLQGWQSPPEVLKRLDAVLGRINRRMVIFLEDIDRNKRTDVFFNELSALLDGLKGLENLSFVLAIGIEFKAQEVLIKTSEHVEVIPTLDHRLVIRMCTTFREHCFSKLDNKARLIGDEQRHERMGVARSEVLESIARFDERLKKPIDWVAALLNNPRVAKLALRRSYDGWDKLCGELDFDDLFMSNVLRAAAPKVFMFINQNIASFQYLASGSEQAKKEAEATREDLHKALEDTKGAEWNFEAANNLVDCLFRGWTKPYAVMYASTRERSRDYQYVDNAWPTDYWARLTREELSAGEVRDQEILVALREWNKDRSRKAYGNMNMRDALLSQDEVFQKVRQFKEFIDDETLRGLAQEQFHRTLEKEKNKASRENCPAISQWFLLAPDPLGLDSDDWRNWFYEQMKTALPVSLRYANDFYHFWVDPKRYRPHELWHRVVEEAKRVYGGDPEVLIKAIDPDRFSVRHFARESSKQEEGGPGFKPEEWQWLGDALFAGMNIKREIIFPQIVLLIGDIAPRPSGETGWVYPYELRTDIASGLFGAKLNQLMQFLSEGVDCSMYDSEIRAYIELCQQAAKKWLADQGNGVVS